MTDPAVSRYVPAPEGLVLLNAAGIRISKGPFYAALNDGSIPSVRVGRKFFVRSDIVTILGDGPKNNDEPQIQDGKLGSEEDGKC